MGLASFRNSILGADSTPEASAAFTGAIEAFLEAPEDNADALAAALLGRVGSPSCDDAVTVHAR
jgi:hypothetical protein